MRRLVILSALLALAFLFNNAPALQAQSDQRLLGDRGSSGSSGISGPSRSNSGGQPQLAPPRPSGNNDSAGNSGRGRPGGQRPGGKQSKGDGNKSKGGSKPPSGSDQGNNLLRNKAPRHPQTLDPMATHNNLRYGQPNYSKQRDGAHRRPYARPDHCRPPCNPTVWYDYYGYDQYNNNYYDSNVYYGDTYNSPPAEPERSFSPNGTFERFDPYGDWSDAEGGYLSNLPEGRSSNR